jgi:hypothetical protein
MDFLINRNIKGMQAFTLVWFGQFISVLGTAMTKFALMIWAYDQVGKATTTALLGFSSILPYVILSPLAGVIVDRCSRKKIMIISDLGVYKYCIVRYYNKKYKRHGHLFQDRFESRILGTDEYNLAVSAYIHNNASDIEGYDGKEQLYPYSSYGIYLGKKDFLGLIDKSFIKSIFNLANESNFPKKYCEFVSHQRDMGSISSIMKQLPRTVEMEYRSERKIILRDHTAPQIISYISDRVIKGGPGSVLLKAKRSMINFRAFCVYAMRTLCGLSYREICQSMYNMTVSGCARLCDKGFSLVSSNDEYGRIFDELINIRTLY